MFFQHNISVLAFLFQDALSEPKTKATSQNAAGHVHRTAQFLQRPSSWNKEELKSSFFLLNISFLKCIYSFEIPLKTNSLISKNSWEYKDVHLHYMAQVTSGKITRCDWLLTWKDSPVMAAGIMKIVNAPWTKTNSKSKKKVMFKEFLCLKTNQNTEMSDEEHSDSEFYYLGVGCTKAG